MIPFSTFGEQIDYFVRTGLVYAVLLGLLVLNVAALPYPSSGAIKIPFILIAIYYWAIYRPTLIPATLVFIAGLLVDLISAGPLGLNALMFVAVYWLVSDQRSFLLSQSFLMIWFGFIVLNALFAWLQWMIAGVVNMQWLSLGTVWGQAFLGVISFPFVAAVLHIGHKILPAPKMPLAR